MAKFIGKIIIRREDGVRVSFVVVDLSKSNYSIFISIGTSNNLNINENHSLGRMVEDISKLVKNKAEIIYNDLPKNIMDIANKEAIILNL